MAGLNAAQVLSYKGNTDLGYTGEGTPVATPNNAINQLSGILKSVEQTNMQWTAMQYQEALKDKERSLEQFAKADIDFPVDENDRERLVGNYDKVKEVMMKYNGNPMANKKGRIEMQGPGS